MSSRRWNRQSVRQARGRAALHVALAVASALALVGCGGSEHVDVEAAALTTLPPSPPICDKNAAELLVFVHYDSPNCSGDGCLPVCQKQADCPRGSQCDTGSGLCRPADCTAELQSPAGSNSVCGGDTICNPAADGTASCGLPPTCADDSHCPCGSYCDPATHQCRLDCLTGPASGNLQLGCSGTLQCDTRGHCSNPAGIAIPSQIVTLAATPASLLVPRDAAGHFSTVSLTVQRSTTNPTVGSQPAPQVTVSAPAGVSISCGPSQPFVARGCTIASQPFQLQGTTYVASQVVQVRVAAGNTSPRWDLRLTSPDQPQPTVVSVAPQPLQQQIGRYSGILVLDAAGSSIPIKATVTASAIEIHDSSHVVAPTGTVLLKVDGSTTVTSFLAGRGNAQLYRTDDAQFKLSLPAPAVDPVSGQLAGTFSAWLATSPSDKQTWSFTLTRTADLTTVAPCPIGESFDATVQACIPGAAWDDAAADLQGRTDTTSPRVIHTNANAWLNAMAARLGDPLLLADGTEQLAEHLLCFDATASTTTPAFATSTKSGGLSGDLQCADSNTKHEQWAVGLVSYVDRTPLTTPPSGTAQYDMLAQCVQQIMTPAPSAVAPGTIDNSSCVSLARFYPALFSVAGAPPYRFDSLPGSAQFDSQSRLLFLRLLQQWSQLASFIARNGTQQRGVADILTQLTPSVKEQSLLNATPASLTYGSLLDAVDNAWTLVLDKRIQQPLTALPSYAVAKPDYRQLHKPLAYWTFAAPDRSPGVINNYGSSAQPLAATWCGYDGDFMVGSTYCTHSATQGRLDRNVTLAVNVTAPKAPLTAASTVLDADGLVVKFVPTSGALALQVGHRIADGTTQFVSFPVRVAGGLLFIERDERSMVYQLTTAAANLANAGSQNELVTLQAHYSAPPAIANDTIMVGASRSSSADYLKSSLAQVALWDSALSRTELVALAGVYASVTSTNTRPVWLSDVTVPPASDANANEPAVGLPVSLLEGLIPTMGLIEAYIDDAALANPAACRRGYTDDGLQRARERAARSLRVAYAVQLIAETLHAQAAAAGTLAWESRYASAVSELQGARSHAIQALANAENCQNPMGLGPKEFPLYFADSRGLVSSGGTGLNVIEASANYLMTKAHDVNEQAIAALANARTAWVQQYQSEVQRDIWQGNQQQRLDDIRASFGKELIDACGIPVDISGQNASTVLQRFLDPNDSHGHLTPQTCFVTETSACANTPTTALSDIDPACVRGQIGEALMAAEAARQRVQRAIIARNAARATKDAWYEHCAQKQVYETDLKLMIDQVTSLEIAENDESYGISQLGTFIDSVSSLVLAIGTGIDPTTGYSNGTGNPTGAFDGMIQSIQLEIKHRYDNEKATEQAMLEKRKLDGDLLDCWNQADLARIPMEGAEQDIAVATSDLRASLAHVGTLLQHVSAVVIEAGAAVTRETNRPVPAIAFHYWADETLALYKRQLERARRMTYLAMRAVEHDLQRSFGLDHDVLAASHPQQLKNLVDTRLAAYLADGIDKLVPTQHFTVLSLCKDVLRLPELNHEPDCDTGLKSQRQFREILLSPANALFENGAYVGQALPFTLDPALSGVEQRCAENLAQVDAHFVADNLVAPLTVQLEKRETFHSTACSTHVGEVGGPTQDGTLRSSNNLLLDGTVPQFGDDRVFTPAQVGALKDGNDGFESSGTPGVNAVPDLAGRGLYGDYRLVVLPKAIAAITADSGDLRDIKIRLDYVSVADTAGTPPVVVAPLVIQKLDGNGQLITTPNSVSATCTGGAPSCTQGSVAQLSAAASSGWHFGDWSGACTGLAASCAVSMDGPRQVFATFVNDDPGVTLSVTPTGTGTGGVASGWLGVVDKASFGGSNLPWQESLPRNSQVTLFATPAADSVFSGWSGGGCSGTGSCTVTLSSAQSISAAFTQKPVLTVQLVANGGGGSGPEIDAIGSSTQLACSNTCSPGTGGTCTTTCTKAFLPNEAVPIHASNCGSYTFNGWSSDCSGASCSLTMSTSHTVTGTFTYQVNHTQCTPGDSRTCACRCGGAFICCEPGAQVCSASGTWGSCSGTVCASPKFGCP